MKLMRIMDRRRICLLCSMLFFSFLLAACGGGSGDSGNNSETGSISFKLVWQPSEGQRQAGPERGWPNPDVCRDYGIGNIDYTVVNSSGPVVPPGSWRCSDHGGTISSVPAGSGITLTLLGTGGWNGDWRGQVPNITVNTNQDSDLGTVVMTNIGTDKTPPAASNPYPTDGATNIPINTPIRVDFSESIVAASAYASSCILNLTGGTTPVAGAVRYTASPPRVTITPADVLALDSNYTVTITTEITDLAGNPMTADYSWSFTTGSASAQYLIWGQSNWGALWN